MNLKLVLATGNKGKVKEIKALCDEHEVIPYSELIDEFEIIEDGSSFKENALIKARAVFQAINEKLNLDDIVVIADDSGISVDALGGEPGIYSARYAGQDASDKDNLYKLVDALKGLNLDSSKAHYTAAIAIITKDKEFSVHGWMHGDVIAQTKGDNGFGYDPMFIPDGFNKTLGELEDDVKKDLSHRSRALNLAKKIIKTL
jgi:XTP/dITP diphosphohydrolase